jgi:ATP-dependent DNA helicase PIF1
MGLKSGVCNKCFLADNKKNEDEPFLYSAANNMDPGCIPSHLPKLTQIEEMVIARAHVHMVMKRVRGHQYRYSGHCVSFVQNNVKFFDALPVLPEELDMILLRPADCLNVEPRFKRQFERDFKIRRSAVSMWLGYLKANHPDYRHIEICPDRLSQLPDSLDGEDVSHRVPYIVDDELREPNSDDPNFEGRPPLAPLAVRPDGEDSNIESDIPPLPTYSMVPNLSIENTEAEQIQEAIAALATHATRQPLPQIPAPSYRSTPIEEIGRSVRLFAMAFPTLFPTGEADWNAARQRSVDLPAYARHMLQFEDGRFGRHPRFRFLIFNMLMRVRAREAARFFVKKNSDLAGLSLEELEQRLAESQSLLSQIIRQGNCLSGSRPFWAKKASSLVAQAKFLHPASPVFVTFSCADMQWDDLHRHMPRYDEYRTGSDMQRKKIVWENVQNNPHVIAYWLNLRFSLFCEHVLRPFLRYDDFWYRFEWQDRGSGHIHAILWIHHGPGMNMSTEELRRLFADFWDGKITAWNPNSARPADNRNPASLPFTDVSNTADQFAAFVNRFQMHCSCPGPSCRRKNKETGEESCRFFYPRPLQEVAEVTRNINKKGWMFGARRNQSFFAPCAPVCTFGWMANTDMQPCTSLKALLEYVAKYCSKAEHASVAYKDLQTLVLRHVNDRHPVLSFASKMLNKLVGERDWSAQEVSHILLGIPLQQASRQVVNLDCRPEDNQDDSVTFEDDEVKVQKSAFRRYKERTEHDGSLGNLTLLEWLRRYDFYKFKLRPRASQRVINYYPQYNSDPAHPEFDDYCRVKMMLHHPFTAVDDLKVVDGEEKDSWAEAFQACQLNHTHHQHDFLDLPPNEEPEQEDEFEDVLPDPQDGDDVALSNSELWAQRRPNNDLTRLEDQDLLGERDVDRLYDWSRHIGRWVVDKTWYDQQMADQSGDQELPELVPVSVFNDEQRKLYDLIVDHFNDYCAGKPLRQLRVNLDGSAGTGKTFTILQCSAKVNQLAAAFGVDNPIIRCAPTGVAAQGIKGRTLHSLFRLPTRGALKPLSTGTLHSLQSLFRSCVYLIIDEKSMVDMRILGFIDRRLKEIFPARSLQPFGGINVVVCGDFHQLPPVGGTPLFSKAKKLNAEKLVGQQAYRSLDTTVRLTKVMRQDGEDDDTVQFRETLSQLRVGSLTSENWRFLLRRVKSNLSSNECDKFEDALRLYYTKQEVLDYNHKQLRDLGLPVKKVRADHTGVEAAKASSDIAEGLHTEVDIAIGARVMLTRNLWVEKGLVNGAMGTVRDISWKEGKDPSKDLPEAIMVQFDNYHGPFFAEDADGSGFVPIFPSTTRFELNGVDCTRTQFPLRVAYAITVHKAQGLTLPRIVLNITGKDFALGLSYVAISRVKTFDGLLFDEFFDLERFATLATDITRWREEDFALRTSQMI